MARRAHPTVEQKPGIGDAIGHYRIIGVAGDGRLGRLYVAEQRGIRDVSKIVALRRLCPELVQSPDFRARFFDVASFAPSFAHPNVITIYEMVEVEGNYFISMEYLPGEKLSSIITKGNPRSFLPPDMAAYVVKQAANGVQYLRDLRAASARPVGFGGDGLDPSSLFVTHHGTVKLFGAGLRPIRVANGPTASKGHALDSSSHAGASLAPDAMESVADPQTDVFTLGVVLWRCLTGHSFELPPGGGALETAVLSQRQLAPSSLRADVPEALDAIAMRALSRDPVERFPSARALSEALDRYLVRRDSRPTPKHVRRWMEQVLDAERESLQMQIAQGRDVENALSLLGNSQLADSAFSVARPVVTPRPRQLWSTGHYIFSRLERASIAPPRSFEPGAGSAPHEHSRISSILPRHMPVAPTGAPTWPTARLAMTPPPARGARAWMVGTMMALCAVIALGTAVILSSSNESSPLRVASQDPQSADRSGRLDVRSSPEGAAVFVDGEPTGLYTPVVLKGLADGRKLLLRVEKAGFASQARQIEIVGGSVKTHAFLLLASDGFVHFAGAPGDARIYVDEVALAENDSPVNLSVGPHAVRVETEGSLIFSGTVVIVAGEQTIRVDGAQTPL
jgi:serine/threonine protein kinase